MYYAALSGTEWDDARSFVAGLYGDGTFSRGVEADPDHLRVAIKGPSRQYRSNIATLPPLGLLRATAMCLSHGTYFDPELKELSAEVVKRLEEGSFDRETAEIATTLLRFLEAGRNDFSSMDLGIDFDARAAGSLVDDMTARVLWGNFRTNEPLAWVGIIWQMISEVWDQVAQCSPTPNETWQLLGSLLSDLDPSGFSPSAVSDLIQIAVKLDA